MACSGKGKFSVREGYQPSTQTPNFKGQDFLSGFIPVDGLVLRLPPPVLLLLWDALRQALLLRTIWLG
jgi:hypothetical protein